MQNKVYIYQSKKSAMQSGKKTSYWLIGFVNSNARRSIDSLMGWVSSANTDLQVSFKFTSQQLAIEFVKQKGWSYEVIENLSNTTIKPKSYASNFTN
jgi:hypothetical protein